MSTDLEALPTDWTRGLAIVAHPDDIEYGASAAIAAWTDAGRSFAYVLATRGEAGIDSMSPAKAAPLREAEERASAAVVGVHTVEFLDHRDGVVEEGLPLRRDLAAAIRRHQPELLLLINHRDTWGDEQAWNQPDHRVVGRAALDAVGDAGNRWIFPELTDQGLAPWGGVRWVAIAATNRPSHYVDVTETFERGVASLLEHRAYIQGLTDEDPETYARNLLTQGLLELDGRQATTFEVFSY